jgi:hypothetical protein
MPVRLVVAVQDAAAAIPGFLAHGEIIGGLDYHNYASGPPHGGRRHRPDGGSLCEAAGVRAQGKPLPK